MSTAVHALTFWKALTFAMMSAQPASCLWLLTLNCAMPV
jgi:hypothetical protein